MTAPDRIQDALANQRPVVALESTVITHGLPHPANLELAQSLESIVRSEGAEPATIGIVDGQAVIGLEPDQLERLAQEPCDKASSWNLAAIMAQGRTAGTTVATTLKFAAQQGIRVFATGGIGGVHVEPFDESADLGALARHPVVTVCAGPKSVLNVPATLERLETLGVPVVGYQSDRLAGFHVPTTDLEVPIRADTPEEVAAIEEAQRTIGLGSGVLVSQPVDEGLSPDDVHSWIDDARRDAAAQRIRGKAVTPHLLAAIAERSGGQTVTVNVRLLERNATLAAQIARALAQRTKELTA